MTEIVRLSQEHIYQIAQIEKLCFSEPWSESALETLLGDNYVCFVALVDGMVAGYVGMYCILDEGNIINVAVHPLYRRQGLARTLLRELCAISETLGLSELYLEVRESNDSARALYTSEGWETFGKRKNYYSHPLEDAVLMKKDLVKGDY